MKSRPHAHILLAALLVLGAQSAVAAPSEEQVLELEEKVALAARMLVSHQILGMLLHPIDAVDMGRRLVRLETMVEVARQRLIPER
jgi:hypothetical protein